MAIWGAIIAAVKAAAAAAAKAAASGVTSAASLASSGAKALAHGATSFGTGLMGKGATATIKNAAGEAIKVGVKPGLAQSAGLGVNKLAQAALGASGMGGMLGSGGVAEAAESPLASATQGISPSPASLTQARLPLAASQESSLVSAGATPRSFSPGKLAQSVGYGMIDKPLPKDANTWDYLGRTTGQIARMNEGSGLGMGSAPAPYEKSDIVSDIPTMQKDLVTVDARLQGGEKKEEIYREMLTKYPDKVSLLTKYFYPNQPLFGGGWNPSTTE